MFSEAAKMSRVFPFWSLNNSDLNPLDYYVWSIVERVSVSQCDVIKDRYWGSIRSMNSATLQRANALRPRIEAAIQAIGDILNNCALEPPRRDLLSAM